MLDYICHNCNFLVKIPVDIVWGAAHEKLTCAKCDKNFCRKCMAEGCLCICSKCKLNHGKQEPPLEVLSSSYSEAAMLRQNGYEIAGTCRKENDEGRLVAYMVLVFNE